MIFKPQIKIINDQVVLSSKVETDTPDANWPSEVYFAYPESYKDGISQTNEPAAAALLLVSMLLGEQLDIRGAVSPKFARGLLEFGRVFHAWLPGELQKPHIVFDQIESPAQVSEGTAVATAFSGGVDSLYTMCDNLPENQPLEQFRLTHGLFLHGFDIELHEVEAFHSAYLRFERLFQEHGLTLIPVETNAKAFSKYRIDWMYMSGGCLLGAGLGLSNLLSTYYVSSGYSYHQIWPNGNTPVTDHLLSTEKITIVHYGAHKKHSEKMKELSTWAVAHKYLRVCTNRPIPSNGQNCSRCNKCLANMVRFELFQELDKFQTFIKPFNLSVFPHWWLIGQLGTQATGEIIELAWKKRRWGIYFGMQIVKVGSLINMLMRKLVRRMFSDQGWLRFKEKLYSLQAKNKLLAYLIRFS